MTKKRETYVQSLKRRLTVCIAKREEQDKDNCEQRKIIENIDILIKAHKHVLPEDFYETISGLINEYERRFTLASDKLKEKHPVFNKKGKEK
jgi:hypothetical protein